MFVTCGRVLDMEIYGVCIVNPSHILLQSNLEQHNYLNNNLEKIGQLKLRHIDRVLAGTLHL